VALPNEAPPVAVEMHLNVHIETTGSASDPARYSWSVSFTVKVEDAAAAELRRTRFDDVDGTCVAALLAKGARLDVKNDGSHYFPVSVARGLRGR